MKIVRLKKLEEARKVTKRERNDSEAFAAAMNKHYDEQDKDSWGKHVKLAKDLSWEDVHHVIAHKHLMDAKNFSKDEDVPLKNHRELTQMAKDLHGAYQENSGNEDDVNEKIEKHGPRHWRMGHSV